MKTPIHDIFIWSLKDRPTQQGANALAKIREMTSHQAHRIGAKINAKSKITNINFLPVKNK